MTRPSRLLVLLEPAKAWLKNRISYRNRRFGGRDDVISKERCVLLSELSICFAIIRFCIDFNCWNKVPNLVFRLLLRKEH
ncbi:hypothetical protein T06_12618 [Trichinella sp. T6]|nr:hypothetical protein T06_12618 [Trichinella sp. T6]